MNRRNRRYVRTAAALALVVPLGVAVVGTLGQIAYAVAGDPVITAGRTLAAHRRAPAAALEAAPATAAWGDLWPAITMAGLLAAWLLVSIIVTPRRVPSSRGRLPAQAPIPTVAGGPARVPGRPARVGTPRNGARRVVVRWPAGATGAAW